MAKIIHEFQLSLIQLRTHKMPTVLLEERKQLLLAILPKYTELVDCHQLDNQKSWVNYVFTFQHPYFEVDTYVELELEPISWKNPKPLYYESPFLADTILKNVSYVPVTPDQQLFPFCS
jgi:hypothetical protein